MQGFCCCVVLVLIHSLIPHTVNALVEVDGTALVVNEEDFRLALQGPYSIIQLQISIRLTDAYWKAFAPFEVNKSVTIQPMQLIGTPIIDATDLKQRYIICVTTSCNVTILGPMKVINPPGPVIDFATPIPTFMSGSANGTITVKGVDVVSVTPTGLWLASNLVYLETNSWWVGDLQYKCQSPVSFIVNWTSSNDARRRYLNYTVGAPFVGSYRLQNVRMVLAKSYVCSNYTHAQCDNSLQICSNKLVSQTPLPVEVCDPTGIANTCATAEDTAPVLSTSSSSGSSSNDDSSLPVATQETQAPRSKWWIGLVVGLLAFAFLVLAAVLLVRYRRTARSSAAGAKQPGGVTASKRKHFRALSKMSQESQDAPRSSVPMGVSPVDPGNDDGCIEYPAGPKLLKEAALHLARNSNMSLTFSNTDTGNTFMTLPAVASTNAESASVIIDMAPTTGPDGLPKLARNPLGATLLTVLGTGATGTVYQGLWQNNKVAIKIIRQAVDSQEDLDALLQFREAALGSELQHPRIVRTLAHALVVPEGIMDHKAGTIIRPGMVEAHIVSALCDMGTLRQWLQTMSRLRTPSALYDAVLLHSVDPGSSLHTLPGSQPATNTSRSPHPNASLYTSSRSTMSSSTSHAARDEEQHAQHVPPKSSLSQSARTSVSKDPSSATPQQTGASTTPDSADGCHASQQEISMAAGESQAKTTATEIMVHDHQERVEAGATGSTYEFQKHGLRTLSELSYETSADDSSPVTAPIKLYPPLAFMPPWHDTGVRVHNSFQAHLLACVDILLEIVDGLGYLLSKGVVHGDLKPQNVLLCSQANSLRGFTVKICDFGIARVLTGSKSHTTVTHAPGTLCYFAPELLSTCRMSPACDMYSLGIIMYEIITCRQPCAKLSMAQVLYKKATGAVDECLIFPQEVPAEYVRLARSCYRLQPQARPALNQVYEALMSIRGGIASSVLSITAPAAGTSSNTNNTTPVTR